MNRAQTKRYNNVLKMVKKNLHSKQAALEKIIMRPIISLAVDIRMDLGEKRFMKIAEWLSNNKVDRYVIFDDDDDMLPEQEPNFIQTDSMYGITNDLAHRAIQILNAA